MSGYWRICAHQSRDQVSYHVALESERQVPQIAHQGHLENLKSLDLRNGIDPFRITIIVPHFPEKTAHQRRQRSQCNCGPLPSFKLLEKVLFSEQHLDGDQDQQRRDPKYRVPVVRRNSNPDQPARGKGQQGSSMDYSVTEDQRPFTASAPERGK